MKANNFLFNLDSINSAQKLYVLNAGSGYTCLGFEVCATRTRKLIAELKSDIKELPAAGSLDLFYLYNFLTEYVKELNQKTGFRSQTELNPKLVGYEGKRIEAILYGEKTRFIVGRSTGWIPAHLEIKTRRSHGGPAITSDPNQVEVIRVIN